MKIRDLRAVAKPSTPAAPAPFVVARPPRPGFLEATADAPAAWPTHNGFTLPRDAYLCSVCEHRGPHHTRFSGCECCSRGQRGFQPGPTHAFGHLWIPPPAPEPLPWAWQHLVFGVVGAGLGWSFGRAVGHAITWTAHALGLL